MKASIKKEAVKPTFKPFNINLEIESEEELRALMALVLTNTSVPKCVVTNTWAKLSSSETEVTLMKLLNVLYESLRDEGMDGITGDLVYTK